MTAAAILRLVRIMQADPKLGILQGLVVGLPSTSAFARIFQFGMRLGMRSWTIGSAWWQADCGPYWGHNAVDPHRAVHRALPHPEAAGRRRARRPCAEPRPDRGGADAPRRLRRARAAGGRPRLGGEPADADRIHPPRPALVPGQPAIRPLPVHAGHEARQPLPARLRHADVPRLAGLDRAAGGRHAGARGLADARRFHPPGRRPRAARRSSW